MLILKLYYQNSHQHVNFPTREKNTLDLVYTSHKGAYKASPLPHIGLSDHITVMLMPAYRPRVKVENRFGKRFQCGRMDQGVLFRTVLRQQTGACSSKQLHTTTT